MLTIDDLDRVLEVLLEDIRLNPSWDRRQIIEVIEYRRDLLAGCAWR